MLRVIIGLVKGLVLGGAVGYGLSVLGLPGAFFSYLACAAVGAVVGVVAGRAPWRAETLWTPIIKMVVGALIGVGLCAVGLHLLPDPTLHFLEPLGENFANLSLHSSPILAVLVGVIYGIFVEVDDGGGVKKPPGPSSASSS